jgi:hypothetical protein
MHLTFNCPGRAKTKSNHMYSVGLDEIEQSLRHKARPGWKGVGLLNCQQSLSFCLLIESKRELQGKPMSKFAQERVQWCESAKQIFPTLVPAPAPTRLEALNQTLFATKCEGNFLL